LRSSIIEKIGFYRNVIEKVSNNPTYPTPDVPMADATTSVDKLENAYCAARDGSHVAVSFMHQCEDVADALFRKLTEYVSRIADGDESKILSSGFQVSKEPAPRQKAEFTVKVGEKPGTMILRRQAVPGARSYLWQNCQGDAPAPESGWSVSGVSTQATYEVEGLTSGMKYWFRVAAVTAEGTGAFSTAISKIAQ
jgi:hypothetical protein